MRLFALLTAFALPALLVAAPVPKDEKKDKDEDAIIGTWKVDKFDFGGPDGPPQEELDKIRFIFEKDGVLRMTGGPQGEEMKGSYKLDTAAKPKAIDMTMTKPDGKEDPALGIYELDADTLIICIAPGSEKTRPEEMKADAGKTAVITFKRVKEEKKDGE